MTEETGTTPIEEPTVDESIEKEELTTEPEPEKKSFTQDELDKIIQKEKAKAYRKAQRELQSEYSAPVKQQKEQDTPPNRAHFNSDEEWLDARDQFRDGQRAKQESAYREQQRLEALDQQAERLYKKAEKVPGFDREIFDSLPLTQTIAGAIMESDISAQLMAFISSNPDEAERICDLSAYRQAVEMDKIEAKLKNVKQSKAPEPVRTIAGKQAKSSDYSDEMSQAEYEAWRKKQGSRWIR